MVKDMEFAAYHISRMVKDFSLEKAAPLHEAYRIDESIKVYIPYVAIVSRGECPKKCE